MRLDTAFFDTAAENMNYDSALFSRQVEGLCIRAYLWPKRGITYPRHREIPSDFLSLDHSVRPTGGGIVFHNPGDLLMTFCFPQPCHLLGDSLKAQLFFVQGLIRSAFASFGIVLSPGQDVSDRNIQFCLSYPSPFELYHENHKVMGIAVRRFQRKVMIQCVIHTQSHFDFFLEYTDRYSAFFSSGLSVSRQSHSPDFLLNSLIIFIHKWYDSIL